MPPPIKLTAKQMLEIANSIRYGVQNADWEGLEVRWTDLSRAQQEAVIAWLRAQRDASISIDPRIRALNEASLAWYDVDHIAREHLQEAIDWERWSSGKLTISGCKEAMNDMLSQVVHFSTQQILAVDRRLAAKQLPPLRELSGKLQRVRAGILKRGKIRTDAEYYVVKEIVCDQASDVTEAERTKFELLLDTYEHGPKK